MMENRQLYKRYNTQSDKKCLRQRLQESVEEINNDREYSVNNTFLHSQNNHNFIHTTGDYFLQDTNSQGNDIFVQQINFSQQIRSRYMTCYNNNQDDMISNEQYLSYKVKNLMKGLKELIKELCLTKNSYNQVQEELQKLIAEFQDSSKLSSNKYFERNTNARQLSCLSQIRVRTIYQIQEPSFNTLTDNDPYSQGLKLFHPFLSGTSFQSEQTQTETRLTPFQQQLLSEYLQRYLALLQKQINRISRYNGQKKLKYLLSTVMKQIFTQIMRFTYETKISLAKKQTNNLRNNFELKVNILVCTLQRMSKTQQFLHDSFNMIRKSIKRQQKADIKLINKFSYKINYLDNLMKFRNRTDIREKFLRWRKNATVIKQTQRIFVMDGIRDMIKDILYEFALNEGNLQRWRFIVWGRMNVFIKSICSVGQCVLFPVDEELLKTNDESMFLKSSITSENHRHYQSRVSSTYNNRKNNRYVQSSSQLSSSQQSSHTNSPSPQINSPDTFRFSQCSTPNRQQYDQNYINEKKLLDEVHSNFSLQEIKACLKHGQIVMHDVDLSKLILIPIKNVAGIVVFKYQINTNKIQSSENKMKTNKKSLTQTNQNNSQSFMNISSFYNLLNALQLSAPVILELMTLKEKFQYFSSRIQKKSHHKFILNHLLSTQMEKPTHLKFSQKRDLTNNLIKHQQKSNNQAKISQFISVEDENNQKEMQQNINSRQMSHEQIDNLLIKMSVKKVFMYHRNDRSYFTCLKYTVNSQQEGENSTIIGKDIVEAIFTQLQKINKKHTINDTDLQSSKCLYLKKSTISFYACPIIENSQIIGFIEMYLDKDFSLQSKTFSNNNINSQNTFIVKTVQSKSEILNQTIVFVTEVIVPMLIDLKAGQKSDVNQKKKQNKCEVCHQSNYLNQKFKVNEKQQFLCQKSNKNSLQLTDINNLFIKATENLNKSQQRLYEIEKIFHHQIQKFHNLLKPSHENSQEEIARVNQQFFTKIFYLETPRTKDDKIFVIKKQKSQNFSQEMFYHTNFNSYKQKSIKLPFIDMLKLFNYKTNMKQFQQQTIQIGVSKLNEIYKSMLRKMKSTQSKTLVQQEGKQNNLESFVQQLLKSTLLKTEVLPLQNDKKYHTLELWLYQLQHINKRYGNDKFYFKISVYPVFSMLDSKNKFLSAIMCSAGIVVNNQAVSQRKNNLRNLSLKTISQFSFKLSQQFLGRIIEVEIKNQSQAKKDIIKHNSIKLATEQTQLQSKQVNIDLRKLTKIQETKLKIYNKNQLEIHRIITTIINLQNQINILNKIKVQKVISQKFHLSFKHKKYETLQRFTEIIEKKIIIKNLTTKTNIFSMFVQNLAQQNLMKSQKYMINSIEFVQKMGNVFIRNKMLKTSIIKLKNLTYQNPSQIIDKLFQPGLKITKKFAIQRIQNILSQKIYGKNSESKIIHSAFNVLKDFSNFKGDISSYEKQISIVKLNSALQRLICQKAYLPYFTNLSKLQKSFYQSISLIRTEIQTMNFYSVNQFLTFINERISIIINSEKRLIQILYGQFIQKVNVQIIIQDQQSKKLETLSVSDFDQSQIVLQQMRLNSECPPIFMMQSDLKKFYISLQLTENQASQNIAFRDLRKFIQNFFENHVSSFFKKFMKLYAKKINTFVLKLSKFIKISAHECRNHIANKQNHSLQQKKEAFSRFMENLFKQERSMKIEYLTCQVEMKSKQLTKLHDFYEKRMKKLTTSQIIPDKSETNMSEFIDEGLFQNIVSKKCIKSLKKNIQNLDMNSENLSIQYQIKSKTVAGYQMLDIINKRERKQAMKEVLCNLSTIINEQSATNLCSTNTFFLSSMRKQMIWSVTSRNLHEPIVEDVIMEEKQKLNYSKASHHQQKNFYDQKFKKTSIKSMTKVLKNLCNSAFSKTFYKINSYSWVNSPKLIR